MGEKFKIAIPEVPIDREDMPDEIFEDAELLTGEEGKRGDNEQLLKIVGEADALIFTSAKFKLGIFIPIILLSMK